MSSFNTTNRIWGTSKNPYNNDRTCGGSSGGDAGLVAASCVPWALVADLSGSIRVPSSFCGIYGFKPTNGRTTVLGTKLGMIMNHPFPLKGAAGPFGKSVDDCLIGLKFLFNENIHKYDDS